MLLHYVNKWPDRTTVLGSTPRRSGPSVYRHVHTDCEIYLPMQRITFKSQYLRESTLENNFWNKKKLLYRVSLSLEAPNYCL